MLTNELFNTDYERRISEGAVDQLEQRRIDDLNMKMDELANRVKSTSNPEHKKSLLKAFLDCKAERDSYYKVKTNEGSVQIGDIITCPGDIRGEIIADEGDRWVVRDLDSEFEDDELEFRKSDCKNYVNEAVQAQPQLRQAPQRPQPRVAAQAQPGVATNRAMQGLATSAPPQASYKAAMTPGTKAYTATQDRIIAGSNIEKLKLLAAQGKAPGIKEKAKAELQRRGVEDAGGFTGIEQVDEAGIGRDIVNKSEKMARATPPTKAGAVASTVKNAAKWLAGKGGPGKEGPTYEGKDDQWSKESDWKAVPKSKSGRPVDPRGEVTHLSDVARRKAEMQSQVKADIAADRIQKKIQSVMQDRAQKKNSKEVNEGFQDFNKVEPYAVCLAGKPVKKFDYYEDARRFHDNWKAKLYREGNEAKAEKITLLPLGLDGAQLNEYFVRSGDDIMSVMSLNLFKDLLGDTNLADYDEEFANSPKWQTVVAEWQPKAEYIQKELAKYQSIGRKLRDAEADAIDATAYDGSDAYENADIAAEYLPKVYNKQAAAIVRLLKDGYANPPAGMHEARDGDVNFGHTVTKGSWIVHTNGKKPMRFKTHTGAKAYAEKNGGKVYSSEFYADKLKAEGSDKKVTIAPAESYMKKLGEDDPNGGATVAIGQMAGADRDTNPTIDEAGDRVDPILIKALNNMPDGLASHGEVLNACYDAYAMELGKMAMKSEYGVTRAYIPQLMDLYKQKYGLTFNEEKTRLDPKCWKGKKIGTPKTKMKGGVRVNNCVPAEESMFSTLGEDQDTSGVESAIIRRIMVAHTDWLQKFGPEKVMQAAEEVAYNAGDVDEIGTSDVSAYVREVGQILGAVA